MNDTLDIMKIEYHARLMAEVENLLRKYNTPNLSDLTEKIVGLIRL